MVEYEQMLDETFQFKVYISNNQKLIKFPNSILHQTFFLNVFFYFTTGYFAFMKEFYINLL